MECGIKSAEIHFNNKNNSTLRNFYTIFVLEYILYSLGGMICDDVELICLYFM